MNILGTGLSGLVGSRVVDLLSPEYSFENLSLETGVDITNKESVDSFFNHTNASWIFHFAAYTDVQGAEKERTMGVESAAWKVNVAATQYIIDNCKKSGKHLLYIDTDYAFDGKKAEYSEEDKPNPLGWYATTKYEGAKRVKMLDKNGLVIRISNPYRAHPVGKMDFVHKMLERLRTGQIVSAPTDQLFAPTFIDDIAMVIKVLLTNNSFGVYHVVAEDALSPFDAAVCIADVFKCNKSLVKAVKFADMFKDRAPVPQYAALKNNKLHAIGIKMHTFHEGVLEMKRQETA